MTDYEILGVSPTASAEQVKDAYHKKVKELHPDQYADNPLAHLAEDKLKEVNAAYNRICNGQTQTAHTADGSGGVHGGGYNNTTYRAYTPPPQKRNWAVSFLLFLLSLLGTAALMPFVFILWIIHWIGGLMFFVFFSYWIAALIGEPIANQDNAWLMFGLMTLSGAIFILPEKLIQKFGGYN